MKLTPILLTTAALISLVSCARESATLNGRLLGTENKTVYLDKLGISGLVTVDSIQTDQEGSFKLKVHIADKQPTIYNLRTNGDMIPLLIAPGENLKLHSAGNISRNYIIEGSEGSEQLRELGLIINGGASKLDSLMTVWGALPEDSRGDISKEIGKEYIDIKRRHLQFIYDHTGSIAGIYALYQRLPNDDVLFNGESDVVYYRMVADSVAQTFPDSPYLKLLQNQIAQTEEGMSLLEALNEKVVVMEKGYPEIELPDMYGQKHKLSDSDGKVIAVYFWSTAAPGAAIANAELREIYNRWKDEGFDIYQVCVDESRSDWINAVQQQKLPWISVNDTKGGTQMVLRLYNVQSVPSVYLIDKQGQIVAKNLFGEQLASKVAELMRR